MIKKYVVRGLFLLFVVFVCGDSVAMDSLGAQISAVPVGADIKIDGDLSDWDLSGEEWFCYSPELADKYSGKIAVMYDDNAIYLGCVIRTGGGPIYNPNTPSERPWEGHDVEFRIITDPKVPFPLSLTRDYRGPFIGKIKTLTFWKNSIDGSDNVNVSDGPPYIGKPESNPAGIEVVITEQPAPDRYVLEAKVLWSALGVKNGHNPFGAGEKATAFLTVMWPGQKRVEALRVAQTGGFGWNAYNVKNWGQILFSPTGNIKQSRLDMWDYINSLEKKDGTPIEIELPKPLKTSVSIVDDDGNILRELIGGKPLPKGKSTIYWDGLDWRGHPVPLGQYKWKAYASPGLSLTYMGGVGSSGQPPYKTNDGTGDWGGDHGNPIDVATDKSGTYFIWDVNEMGKGIVKIGADGKTLWRNTHFIMGGFAPSMASAANGKYFYLAVGTKNVRIARFDAATGLFKPFSKTNTSILAIGCDTGEQPPEGEPIDFTLEKLTTPSLIGMAANEKEFFLADYLHDRILVYDAESGKLLRELPCKHPRGICLDVENNLWVISKNPHSRHYGKLLLFEQGSGEGRAVMNISGLRNPWDVAVSQDRIYISDPAFSNQIWCYNRSEYRLVKKIGIYGGRQWGGKYTGNGLLNPVGMALDKSGKLLVAQHSIPKVFQRYSIENDSYMLEQEWFGACAYSPSAWPDSDNPLKVYVSERKGFISGTLKGDGSNASLDAYWSFGNMGYPEEFDEFGNTMQIPTVVRLVNGKKYIYTDSADNPARARGILRVDGFKMTPVGYVRDLGTPLPGGDAKFGIELWSDLNHDGKPSDDEKKVCYELGGIKLTNPKFIHNDSGFSHVLGSMWMANDGSIYLVNYFNRIFRIPVDKIDSEGVITWSPEKATVVADGVIPGVKRCETSYRFGILGVRVDDEGNVYTVFSGNTDYDNPDLTKRMNAGLGHTGNMNMLKLTKFNSKGKREWMVGRKATGVAKPGELYNHWCMAGLVGKGYSAAASEWTPVAVYSPDGFFVDTLLGDPNSSSLLDAYNIGGGETFAGRMQWFPKRGECYIYTGSTAGLVYKVNGFTPDGVVKDEMRFSGTVELKKYGKSAVSNKHDDNKPMIIAKLAENLGSVEWNKGARKIYDAGGKELAAISLLHDATNIYAHFSVNDATPLDNRSDSLAMAFKGGDCVGIYLGLADKHKKTQRGDIRILATKLKGKPVVIGMIPESRKFKNPQTYYTPAGGRQFFDFVGVLESANVSFKIKNEGYEALLTIPKNIFEGLSFESGESVGFEAEVLLSGMGQRGFQVISRNHLYTPSTAGQATMVDDVPSEARLYPEYWKKIKFE